MRALDLFSGAGGAARGLQLAGFHVTGVDLEPQPNYAGDEFHQADAITFPLEGYDFIWASPPCQQYSVARNMHADIEYPDLVAPTRERLVESGIPYVIENVVGAPLMTNIILCGEMFGLKVFRHRLFEGSMLLLQPPHPRHPANSRTNTVRGSVGQSSFKNGATHITVAGNNFNTQDGALAMGIDWMNHRELALAIPPAYSAFIGNQVRAYLEASQ